MGTAVNISAGEAMHQHRHRFRGARERLWLTQQRAARRKLRRATAIAQDTVVPNAHEPLGQDVQEETPHEFLRFQGHDVPCVAPVRIAPLEGDLAMVERHETVIADGDAVGVAAEVAQGMMG